MMKRVAGYLAEVEIWLVACLVLMSMVAPATLAVCVGGMAALWIARWVARGNLSVRTAVDWPMIGLGVMIPVTLYATALPEITWQQVLRLLSGIGLFYAVVNWVGFPGGEANSRKRMQILVWGAVLAGIGLAVIAPFSVKWVTDKIPFLPEALYSRFVVRVADAVHPNVLAGSLVLLLPIPVGILIFDWRKHTWAVRLGLLASGLALLGVVVLTESRGAWLATAVALTLLVILRGRWGWLGVAAGGIGGAYLAARLGVERIIEMLVISGSVGGVEGRLEIWSRARFMIEDFPFTGIGMGSFGKVVDTIYPLFYFEKGSIPHAHNLFLQVAVDLGIPGLMAWLAILGSVIAASWRVYRSGRQVGDGWLAGLGAGLLCSQVALIAHGMTDAVTWGMVRPAPLVWGIWGITVATLFILRGSMSDETVPGEKG